MIEEKYDDEILQLWSGGKEDKNDDGKNKLDEAVDRFFLWTQDIIDPCDVSNADNASNGKIVKFLIAAFNNGMFDLLARLNKEVYFPIYETMISEAVFRLDIPFVEKLLQHITVNNGGLEYYRRGVLKYLQRGHHYGSHYGTSFGTFSLGSLQDIIDGSVERIGNADNVYANEYCNRVCGVIEYEDSLIWDKLNKSNWTDEMFEFFYYQACVLKNYHVVANIEKLISDHSIDVNISIDHKVFKCIQLDDCNGLQKMIDQKESEKWEKSEDFERYLLLTIFNNFKSNFKLIDIFIDNFDLDLASMKVLLLGEANAAKSNKYQKNIKNKNFLFHLIKRGLFQHFPGVFDDYSLFFVTSRQSIYIDIDCDQHAGQAEENIQDICFLVINGLTNVDSLRKLFHQRSIFKDNFYNHLTTLFVRLYSYRSDNKSTTIGVKEKLKIKEKELFDEGERDEIKNHLESRKCLLNQYLLPELVSIVLSYAF
jgi:hypothetical protein